MIKTPIPKTLEMYRRQLRYSGGMANWIDRIITLPTVEFNRQWDMMGRIDNAFKRKFQEAFYEDTEDVNSWETVKTLKIRDLVRYSKKELERIKIMEVSE